MTEAYYDNNPPMCYMVFVPVILLTKLGLPLWTALTLFTFLVAGVSLTLLASVLRLWPDLSLQRYWGVLAAWALGALLLSRYEFGQKDHFIALTILPFLLLQLAITEHKKIPLFLMGAVCLLAVPCLLVKPHYGLLPVLLLSHRMWLQRRLSIIFDFDFLALACGVILYGLAIAIWFPDFINDVLFNSLRFYVSKISPQVFTGSFGLILLSLCLLVLSALSSQRDSGGLLAITLCWMVLAASFIYFIQFKGFGVHMLPAITLLMPASFMTLSLLGPRFLNSDSKILTGLTIVVIIFSGYVILPLQQDHLTAQDYKESSLGRLVREKAHGSSFFMQSRSTNVIVPVSLYTDIPVASRFSLMWFLEGISGPCGELSARKCQEKNRVKEEFTAMLVQDLEEKRPRLVAVIADPVPGEDLLGVLNESESFRALWKNYRKAGQYTLDYREYFKRPSLNLDPPVLYDLYVLNG